MRLIGGFIENLILTGAIIVKIKRRSKMYKRRISFFLVIILVVFAYSMSFARDRICERNERTIAEKEWTETDGDGNSRGGNQAKVYANIEMAIVNGECGSGDENDPDKVLIFDISKWHDELGLFFDANQIVIYYDSAGIDAYKDLAKAFEEKAQSSGIFANHGDGKGYCQDSIRICVGYSIWHGVPWNFFDGHEDSEFQNIFFWYKGYPKALERAGRDEDEDGILAKDDPNDGEGQGSQDPVDEDGDGFYTEPYNGKVADCDDGNPSKPWLEKEEWVCVSSSGDNDRPVDMDGDGFYTRPFDGRLADCNDNNDQIHPGADEQCDDGIDQDCNGEDATCETKPDLHITSVKGGLCTEEFDDMNHSITETLRPGQAVCFDAIGRFINESSGEANDVDFDWRIEDNKHFDDDDLKLEDENPLDMDPGEKIKKTLGHSTITMSPDGTYVRIQHEDAYRDFPIISGMAKAYVFIDVEEKPDGDHDISSENARDEYLKIEITLDRDFIDQDQDGFTPDQGDCNDYNPEIHPGAIETDGDGIDQDCGGTDGPDDVIDVHITHHHIRPFEEGSWHERVDKELGPGESFIFHTEARVENRSAYDLNNVTIDYGIATIKDFDLLEGQRKILASEQINILLGEKENKTLPRSTVTISEDLETITISTENGNSFIFPITEEDKTQGEITFYFYINVETEGGWDSDVSSEASPDEYGKLTIQLLPITSKFTASVVTGQVPLSVNFADQSIGNILNWSWDFGDGNTAVVINPTNIFNTAGTFNTVLTVENAEGYSRTSSLVITVDVPPPPTVTITNPTATDDWRSSKDHTIRWNWANFPYQHAIKIEYSCNGGSQWRTIYDGYTTNDGSKKWKMDKSKTKDTNNGYIRILSWPDGLEVGRSPRFEIDHARGDPKW